jgi:hypothetical protein
MNPESIIYTGPYGEVATINPAEFFPLVLSGTNWSIHFQSKPEKRVITKGVLDRDELIEALACTAMPVVMIAVVEACFGEASRAASEAPEKPWYPVRPEGFGPWIERDYGEPLPENLKAHTEIYGLSTWSRERNGFGSHGRIEEFLFDDIGTKPGTIDNFICAYAIKEA